MNRMKSLVLAAVLAIGASTALVHADYDTPRQYYSGWNYNSSKSYYYRYYYYKPTPTYSGYKHHYVLYYPKRPGYYYFYNPHKKQFWGRCPIQTYGQPQYSLLAETDRRADINDIPERAFPRPGPLPVVPETEKEKNPPTLDPPPASPVPGKIDLDDLP